MPIFAASFWFLVGRMGLVALWLPGGADCAVKLSGVGRKKYKAAFLPHRCGLPIVMLFVDEIRNTNQ